MDDPLKPTHETIFAEAITQPAEARRDFVQRACGEDRALAAHVLELVRGYEENSGFLEASPAGAAATSPANEGAATRDHAPGDRIGPYKLLERIGEGACGIVYMAEQEQPVRRRVALKLIKLGLDTQEFVARFEAERQALALMDHPHIARVFDAGATERGRPFFVMELVRGVPITRFCDENQLAPAARLELFISVCHAIQHAHQKGIIHRDIKPSNILVAVNDGEAVPKVIDFGIAKATQGRLTDKTLFTRFHAFIGTPAYSSPEQAEVTNLDVDTRSDVYSLGVLLYELLTGHQPVDHATIERLGFEELRRLIREVEPPRPSARVSSLGLEERTSVAQRRAVDTAKLALLLRSDLDWIVMRCLEKDRRRRYESASALAQDVRRHLDSEPVSARPPSFAYRLHKFLHRHRTAAVAVGGIAAAVVAGLIVSSLLLLRERAAHARAVDAERAETELRAEAEAGRGREIKRSSRAALNLARQLLKEGRTSDGLAYLVHAARRDPENTEIAARLVSVLTTRNFLLPDFPPYGCNSRVLALHYTKDGRLLFVGTQDGTFRVFDALAGTLVREVRLDRAVKRNGWVFPRDNDGMCVIRFVGDTFSVLDVASGRLRFSPLTLDPRVLPGEGLEPQRLDAGSMMASPDGRWVLACGLAEFWVWDARSAELKIQRDQGAYSFCTFSSDGTRFAEVSKDTVAVWSLPDVRRIFGPLPLARHIARPGVYLVPQFSPDGQTLAVVDPWEAIHVFDAATGELRHSWPHVNDYILPGTIQMLPDGRLFCKSSGAYLLWDLTTGERGQLPNIGWSNLRNCDADASGARLLWVTPTGVAHLIDTATGREITEEAALHGSGDVVAALSPDGERVVAGTGQGELRWLRVGRGSARPLQIPALVVGFNTGGGSHLRVASTTESRVIDIRTGRDVVAPVANPRDLSRRWVNPWFTPGARFLVVPDLEHGWESWDYGISGRPRVVRLEDNSTEHFYEFSPEGNFNAFLRRNSREVGVWNLATGQLAGPKISHDDDTLSIQSIRVGAEGRVLTTGFDKGFMALWETSTGRLLTRFDVSGRGTPNLVNLSPDGRRVVVVTTFGEAQVFDVASGQAVSPVFEVAPGGVLGTQSAGAVFSPDGRWLATVEARGTRLRDAVTFAPVGDLLAIPPVPPDTLFFNRDGTRLCAVMSIFDVPSGEPITDKPEDVELPGGIGNPRFSPDGSYLCNMVTVASERVCRIRSVPPPARGARVPEWLLQLTTNIAGREIDDAEQSVAVPSSRLQLENVRRELAALSADAPFAEWGRWILDDRVDRPIAPGFTITPAEADKLMASGE